MPELIGWVGNNAQGYFEVDGVRTEVPEDAELAEIIDRLVGRTIIEVENWLDGYALRLDDGQVLDISGIWQNDSTAGTGVRFWNSPQKKAQ